jgi:hypothetical protein
MGAMNERGRESDWQEPSAGLRMVANAMVLQLILVVFTLLTIMFVVASKKPDGMQAVAMLLAGVGLVAQILMVVGVFRFSNQPAPPLSAHGLAKSAGVLGIVGIAISAYVLFILVQVSSVGPDSPSKAIESAMDAAESLPKIEVAAAVLGFLAMVLMLAAASSVAVYFQQPDIERRAKTAIAMVLLAAAIYAFIKLGVTPRETGGLVAALVMTTIVQVAAFVNILATVRGLSDALLSPPPPDVPRARSL